MKELKEQCLLRGFVLCQCCRFCDVSVQWCFFFFTLPFGLTASFWYPRYHHQCAHWEFSFQQRSLRPYFDPVFRGRFRLGIVLRGQNASRSPNAKLYPCCKFLWKSFPSATLVIYTYMVHEHSHSTTCMCVQGLSWWCCHAAVCWWFTAELKHNCLFSLVWRL